jgi:hypothetical protein
MKRRSISDIDKKRGRGRPTTDATPIMVRVLPDQLSYIDAWIASKADEPSRPEAIRRLVELGLKAKNK